jgi:hypothetical protein
MRRWKEALAIADPLDMASGENIYLIPKTNDYGTFNFGNGSADMDVKVFLGSTTEYVHFDVGNSYVRFNVPLRLDNNTGAAAASGLLLGGGTSADPMTTSTADGKFIELRCETSAASGDNRLAYLRYSITGAGGGECLRALTSIDGNTGTAHGAHLSLAFLATAGGSECSGLGAAVRGTLHIPDIASWAPTGTYAAGMFEIYSDGTASDPAGMTELAVLRLCNSGNATGAADVDTDAYLFSLQGWTAAADTTKAISSVSLAELPTGTIGIRILVGSSVYFIPAVATAEWN